MHFNKQPLLPVFMNWLHIGEDSTSRVCQRFWEPFGGWPLWASVYNSLIEEVCPFLFQGFVISCSLQCLSAVLQVHWCYCNEVPTLFHCPWIQSMLSSRQFPEADETDTSPLGNSPKIQIAKCLLHSFPFRCREKP